MSTDRKRTLRVVSMAAHPGQEEAAAPAPGDVYCLVEYTNMDPGPWERRWNILTSDPRTNMSQQSLWEGWLGCTNGTNAYALGAYRVVSVHAEGSRYRVSLAPASAPGQGAS